MAWRVPPPGVLKRVELDTMTAIYDRRSAMTHVVAAIVPTIIDAFDGCDTVTTEELAQRLGADIDLAAGHLDELAAVGLLERL